MTLPRHSFLSRLRHTCRLVALVALGVAPLSANPAGGHVVAGAAAIAGGAGQLTVHQTTARAILHWQDFSIGAGELVRFVQPDATSAALNRVLGGNPSSLLGDLQANGRIFLINPNGVLVGAGARIDTAGFLASTLDVNNRAFLSGGDLLFKGDSTAAITNLGGIEASGGDIFLIARQVENRGTLSAHNGTAGLAAGSEVLLTTNGSQRVFVQAATAPGLVVNAGEIAATTAELKAGGGNPYALAINQTGVIRATGTTERDGAVWLVATTTDGLSGLARHTGEITAVDAGGRGGFVETSGETVAFSGAVRTGAGGRWLIDPIDVTIDAVQAGSIAASIDAGTDVTVEADNDITVAASIAAAGSGSLNLKADIDRSGAGTVVFDQGITISNTGSGDVNLFYNPASYGSPTDYSSHVNLGGGGKLTAYMWVHDVNGLQGMSANLAGHYALSGDIDARDTILWNSGAGFVPVGSGGAPFTGLFDGLGNTIHGLRIDRGTSNHVGLFGALDDAAHVRNVSLAGGFVAGYDHVGAIAGRNAGTLTNVEVAGTFSGRDFVGGLVGSNSGTIADSYATGAVSGSNQAIGGAVGTNSGTISRSYATGSVAGLWDTGGLAGYNEGDIVESYSTGAVSADFGGGLVGWNDGAIVRSYATGAVSAVDEAGGLVGGNTGEITESYATGFISGWSSIGGLVAYNEGTISQSYWDVDSTGVDFSDGGALLGTPEAKAAASYSGWDIGTDPSANTWVMIEGQTRPMLAWEYSTRIANGHQLQLVGLNPQTLAAHYTVVRDLDLSGTSAPSSVWGGGSGFVPIGSRATPFTGVLDGHGHAISGLTIDRETESDVGLFGVAASTAQIRHIGLSDGSVKGNEVVGALVGLNDGGVIAEAYSTAAVSGVGASVGGLVGHNRAGTISESYATGTVSGVSAVGGLVGHHEGGSIADSYATGVVSGNESAGALVGQNDGAIATSYWNIDTAGVLPGVGAGVVEGVSGMTTEEFFYLRLPSGFSAGTWYAKSGVYPQLRWQLASLPENTLVGQLVGAGEGVALALVIDGEQVATTVTAEEGAFVFYYAGEFAAGTGALVYADGGDGFRANRLVSLGGTLTEDVAVADQQIWVSSSADTFSALVADLGATLGGFSDDGILYSFSGDAFGVTAGIQLRLDLSSNVFTFDGALNLPGATLRIDAPGSLVAPHPLVAGGFILDRGEWLQHDAALPVFDVDDFRIEGGRFLRAVGGDGSRETPWLLADVYGLQGVSTGDMRAHYALTADIDATGTVNWNGGAGFAPIGGPLSDVTHRPSEFNGTLDGRGHVIAGLTIHRPSDRDVGLFGTLGSLAEIRDLGMTGGSIAGGESVGSFAGTLYGTLRRSYTTGSVSGTSVVGGLVGYAGYESFAGPAVTLIENSYATGAVTSAEDSAGGLVGHTWEGEIRSSYATGDVTGGFQTGGLVGTSIHTSIVNSYATGDVAGEYLVGGLVGINSLGTVERSYASGSVTGESSDVGGLVGWNERGTVKQSYATGAVAGEDRIGGLVGDNERGTILQSYAIGAVSGDDDLGGFIGYNHSNSTVSESVWDVETSGQNAAVGGGSRTVSATGLTTMQMTDPASYAGWDIDAVGGAEALWRIYPGHTAPLFKTYLTRLEVSGADKTVTYDGTGHTSTYTVDGPYDASLLLGGSVVGVNAGNHVVTSGLYSTQHGYDLVSTGGILTILPVSISVTANGGTSVYGDAPADPGLSATGLVNDETVAVLTGLANSFGIIGTTNAGAHTLTVTGTLTNGNYTIAERHDGTWTVTPKEITVTANGGTSVYGDTPANPGLSATGLVNDETAAMLTGLANSFGIAGTTNAGTHTLVVEGTLTNGNYTVAARENGTWVVSPKAITVTANGGTSVYGDTPANPGFSAIGLVNGETAAVLTGLANSFGIAGTTNAGSHTLTVEGMLTNGNYTVAARENGTWVVSPRTLTAALSGTISKTYDGTTDAVLSGNDYELVGLVNGDRFTISAGANTYGTYNSANVAEATTVSATLSSGDITADAGTLASNYVLPTSAVGAGVITPKSVTVTAHGGSSIYGDSPADPGFSASGLVNGETAAVLTGLANSFGIAGTTNAGTHTLVVEGTLTNGNYTVAARENGTWVVSPKAITVTANSGTSTYGDAPANPGLSATGLVNGETAAVLAGLANSFGIAGTTNAGTHTLVVEGTLTNGNYTVTARHDGTWVVSPKAITVTAIGGSSVYGDTPANPGLSATGLVNGETAAVLAGLANSFGIAGTTNAGTHTLVVEGALTNGNYTVAAREDGAWIVSPKELTVAANDVMRPVNAENPAFTARFDGFVNGETADVVSGLTFATPATRESPIGTYAITPGNGTAANYTLVYVDGVLTVFRPGIDVGGEDVPVVHVGEKPAATDDFAVVERGGRRSLVPLVDEDTGEAQPLEEALSTSLARPPLFAFTKPPPTTSASYRASVEGSSAASDGVLTGTGFEEFLTQEGDE